MTLNQNGTEALAEHFFGTLAEPNRPVCKKKSTFTAVCAQGKRDATNVSKFMTGLNSRSAEERRALIRKSLVADKRVVQEECGCGGCVGNRPQNSHHGVMYGNGVDVKVSDEIRITKSFGLDCLASTSLLRLLKHKYPGITMPFLYFGSLHSFFPGKCVSAAATISCLIFGS